MTTSQTPKRILRQQAAAIAEMLKKAERGEPVNADFDRSAQEARERGVFKVAIAMDDKIVSIEMTWETIRDAKEAALREYVLELMLGQRETRH